MALAKKQKPEVPDNLTIYTPPPPPPSPQHLPPSFTATQQRSQGIPGRARSPAARSAGGPRAPAGGRRAWQIDERAGEEEEDEIYDSHHRFENAGGYSGQGGGRYSMARRREPPIYRDERGRFQKNVRRQEEYDDEGYVTER